MIIIALIIIAALVVEILFVPRLDYTREAGLLLWYNDVDGAGNKTRNFKKII